MGAQLQPGIQVENIYPKCLPHLEVVASNSGNTVSIQSGLYIETANKQLVQALTHAMKSLPHFHVFLFVFHHRQPHGQVAHHLLQLILICTENHSQAYYLPFQLD